MDWGWRKQSWLILETVWAFVDMKEIVKKRRCLSHKRYVTRRMAELSNELLQEAIETGIVNLKTRQQLLKYKEYLNNL